MCEIVIPFAPLATTPFPLRRIIDNHETFIIPTTSYSLCFFLSIFILHKRYWLPAIIQAITFPTIERGTLAIDRPTTTETRLLVRCCWRSVWTPHLGITGGSAPAVTAGQVNEVPVSHKKLRIVYARSCDKKTERGEVDKFEWKRRSVLSPFGEFSVVLWPRVGRFEQEFRLSVLRA